MILNNSEVTNNTEQFSNVLIFPLRVQVNADVHCGCPDKVDVNQKGISQI
jgi:hypothetical protein